MANVNSPTSTNYGRKWDTEASAFQIRQFALSTILFKNLRDGTEGISVIGRPVRKLQELDAQHFRANAGAGEREV